MVYDPDAFQAAEITAPPKTWDELRATAQKLLDATGQPGIVYGPNFDRYIAFLYQAGGSVLSADGKQVTIGDDKTKQSLDFYYGLYSDGLVATAADVGAQWPGDAFAKGLAAIVFEGNWMFPFLEENAPDKKVGIAELPAGPGGRATMAFTVCYGIFGKTQVADAAWTLVSYLTGPDGMKAWTDTGLATPSRVALAEGWQAKFPDRAPFLTQGDVAKPWQFGPGGQKFFDDANAILQSVFAGETDTATAASEMAEKAKADITLAQ